MSNAHSEIPGKDSEDSGILLRGQESQDTGTRSSALTARSEILDVTPVNSEEGWNSDSSPLLTRLISSTESRNNDDNDDDDDDDDDDAYNSSSSNDSTTSTDQQEEDDEDDNEEETSPREGDESVSEWDRAVLSGKASTGRASDFFATQQVLSTDSSEFFSNSQAARATTPGIRSTSDLPPRSPAPSQLSQSPPLPPPPPHPHTTSRSPNNEAQPQQQQSQPQRQQQPNSGTALPAPGNYVNRSSSATVTSFDDADLSAGVLPDVLMTMRQKIEELSIFDSDILKLTEDATDDDPMFQESRESLKRSSQQSISAAVLVSLAHKRYERRRLAAMEIEKVVRSLVLLQQQKNSKTELDRVRAILLLLSDDYVRSTSEDARKGGVVALAACAIGLKKANDNDPVVAECRDLILASVVHACQDHSQRVRYYATESLFNVVKVIPSLAVQHFFILFEILRSLFADVDSDVRSGAELLDKKLKEVIVGAMNAGIFTADACVPVFARFVYMRNKATKRLTLTWLQELNEKLVGAPILEFLHLFLGGIFDMVADPTVAIRQSALAFLQSVLPKLLVVNSGAIDDMGDQAMKVDFDKILQSLVTTMEHANPFVRKVAMYWMSRIVKAHMMGGEDSTSFSNIVAPDGLFSPIKSSPANEAEEKENKPLSAASISVRNALPHVLPGILLSIGDKFVSTNSSTTKDAFLPDQTTRSLAEQTNECLQDAVRRDGQAYVKHLDGFIVALREELTGGFISKNPPAVERTPYRMDVQPDGTGIETAGWFRSSRDTKEIDDDAMVMSRLCALHWIIVLYESVVPDALKADYAREFVFAIIHQLADRPPETIVRKSLEVLATITVPVLGEDPSRLVRANPLASPAWTASGKKESEEAQEFPMTDSNVANAMKILAPSRRRLKSRDREVFSALIELHSHNEHLLAGLSNVITYMCKLQPPEFVMVSFAVELDRFLKRRKPSLGGKTGQAEEKIDENDLPSARDLRFASSFVQHMNHVLLNTDESKQLRDALKDCIAVKGDTEQAGRQRCCLFHILLHSFAHNIAATLSLCLWAGAYRTASSVLNRIDPLDINLIFLLEIDRLVELLERPLFRHLHVRMLERDLNPTSEGSGVMLFQLLKSLLMILPQSTCYSVLRDRLTSVSRFRQSTIIVEPLDPFSENRLRKISADTSGFVSRVQYVRGLHCMATWQSIRQESLEIPKRIRETVADEGADRRGWLGYASKEEQKEAAIAYREEKKRRESGFSIEEVTDSYLDLDAVAANAPTLKTFVSNEDGKNDKALTKQSTPDEAKEGEEKWKDFWATADK